MPVGCSIGKSRSSTGASFPQKKGPSSRADQAGKGHKAHGSGRWQGSSSGKLYRLCFAGRGPGRPRTRPKRLIGDKAYDSDPLRKRLKKRGVSLLSPHRRNHRNVNRQDDRLWDRYRKRYIVERTFSRFGNFRRLVVRYEHQIGMYVAFIQIACVMIVIKRL
jgi:transposase